MNVYKTLIGKNGYLFLQNDSARELEVHCNNLCLVSDNFYKKYLNDKHKLLHIVMPNKSYICNKYLPDGYNCIFRPGYEKYVSFFSNHLLDGVTCLKNDDENVFYKTDTHMNLYGAYIMYKSFVRKTNELFDLQIEYRKIYIQKMENVILRNIGGKGIGDLTWHMNLGDQILDNIEDDYFYTNDFEEIYMSYKIADDFVNGEVILPTCASNSSTSVSGNLSIIRILQFNNKSLSDVTSLNIGTVIDWHIISKYILYKKNNIIPAHKVLIFYDSFLLSTLPLYISMFNEIYLSKSAFNNDLIELINPDYIFVFQVERFMR